ncbi:MAG: hypothetical protein ACI4K6_01925 [Candidatus Fimenecus sp.]
MAKIAAWGMTITLILEFFVLGLFIFTDSIRFGKLLPGIGFLWAVFFALSKIFGKKENTGE